MDDGLLRSVGLRAPELISGFAGGLVRVMFTRWQSPAETIAATFGGAITSNYLAEPFAKMIGKIVLGGSEFDIGLSGFVVGLTAMVICQSIIQRIGMWAKKGDGNV